MRKRSRKGKKLDINELASSILEEATNPQPESKPESLGKNPAAVELGRLGGLKGGKARAMSLSKRRRKEIAQKAANKRWGK